MTKRVQGLAALMALALIAPLGLYAAGNKEAAAASSANESVKTAKYVFLFIGDGMSMTQVNAAEIYTNARANDEIKIAKLGFTQFPVSGLTTTYDYGSFITDSASSATALATGKKTLSGVINMDPGKTVPYTIITEQLKAQGWKIGVVSNVSIDHATPAAFYAKVPSRGNMYDIAVQLGDSGFDYFGGGGFAQPTGKKKDQADVVALAKEKGYTFINDAESFRALKAGAGKVLAVNPVLQDAAAMPYDMDRGSDELSLADFVAKGIELLDNDKGFFLMTESGKIDWACHANDAAASINDTLAFDRAIAEAVAFYNKHPEETLIVVTGDHETGGMTLGFAGTKYATFFDKVAGQKGSFQAFNDKVLGPYKASTPVEKARLADLLPRIEEYFGIAYDSLAVHEKEQLERAFQRSMGNEIERAVSEEQYLLYGDYEPLTVKLTHIMNQHAGIGWTSYSHTGVPVVTFALGVGAELFGGYYDNTDIHTKLLQLAGLSTTASAAPAAAVASR